MTALAKGGIVQGQLPAKSSMSAEPSAIHSNQRYQVLFELGRGGMGTAYLARALGTEGFERLVVIKRLHQHLTTLDDVVQRFLDEARLAAAVYHANVVGTQYSGKDEEGYLLVLDYVEGASLEELVDRAALRNKRVPVPILLRIALDTLAGLQAVHTASNPSGRSLNILHRDISLQNLLVGRDGVTRVADFGIARSTIRSAHTTQGIVMGKLIYLPREHLSREPVGPSLDIYSLGVTLWIAITGEEPWFVETEAQLLKHIMTDRIPRISERMEIDPDVEMLIERATDPDPALRFQSALEMTTAIESIIKNPGRYAGYSDVARFVGELMDVDLGRRRERIRSLLERPPVEVSSTIDVPLELPFVIEPQEVLEPQEVVPSKIVRPASSSEPTKLSVGAADMPASVKRTTRKRTIVFVSAAVLASALGAFAAFRSHEDKTEPGPSAIPPPEPAVRAAASLESAPRIEVAPTTTPPATAASNSPPISPAKVTARPRKTRTGSTAKSAAADSTSAPRAPDDISKRNPYRQSK